MTMTIEQLLHSLTENPSSVEFQQVIDVVNTYYRYTPVRFINGCDGEVVNEAGTNEGSCRIFAFAAINQLTKEQTLHCFGEYYRDDVLGKPEGSDHANIRTFIKHGWEGISFDEPALALLPE